MIVVFPFYDLSTIMRWSFCWGDIILWRTSFWAGWWLGFSLFQGHRGGRGCFSTAFEEERRSRTRRKFSFTSERFSAFGSYRSKYQGILIRECRGGFATAFEDETRTWVTLLIFYFNELQIFIIIPILLRKKAVKESWEGLAWTTSS